MTLKPLDRDRLVDGFADSDAMPASVARLCVLLAGGRAEIAEITQVVEHDQVLTGHLLRRANSAASSAVEPVRTVRDAAVRLGPAEVLSVALAASVSQLMRHAQPAYTLVEGDLWRRSVAASASADAIRSHAALPLPQELGTAALLHDVGKVAIGRALPLEHLRELRRVHQQAAGAGVDGGSAADPGASAGAQACLHDETMLATERRILGLDHAQVGAALARRWGLPASMVSAIALHHQMRADGDPCVVGVGLAHGMVIDVLGARPGGSDQAPSVPGAQGSMMLALGIDPGAYDALLDLALRRYEQIVSTYDI